MNARTMTNLFSGSIGKASLFGLLCSSGALYGQGAGVTQESVALTPAPAPVDESATAAPAVGSAVSFSLALDFNTHFISYGADVYNLGNNWKRLIVNPSISMNVDLGENFYGFAGLWMDINSYGTSSIGGKVQEVDAWVGLGYVWNDFTLEVTYQEWMYASSSERIVDVALSYDTFLNPRILLHNRVEGNYIEAGKDPRQKRGTVFVLGGSHTFSFEQLEITIPVDVAFATKDYHGGDGGFAYVTTGVNLSYPLSFISEAYGQWTANMGVSYYYTNDKVIPGNRADSFVTGTFGIGMDF